MYGGGHRRGLGMYGGGHRRGLGMYGAGHTHGLGATPSPIDGSDPFAVAVQFGIEPNTAAGQADYAAAQSAITTGGRKALTLARPELAAALTSYVNPYLLPPYNGVSNAGDPLPSQAAVIGALTQVNDTLANDSQFFGIWSDLPSDIVSRYAAMVNQLVPIFYQHAQQALAAAPAITASNTAQANWTAALAAGAFNVPLDGGGSYPIPTSAIVEGPVTLPDGTHYVVYQGDPHSPNQRDILVWHDASYVGAVELDVAIQPGSCTPVKPGTGSWYLQAAVNNDVVPSPCNGIPTTWSQGFGLVGPAAKALLQGSPLPPYLPAKPAPAPAGGGPSMQLVPAQLPPLYTPPVTVPTGPPTSGGTQNGLAPIAVPPLVDPSPASPQVPPTINVLYQPPAMVGPGDQSATPAAAVAAPAPAGLSLTALAALGAGLALLLSMQHRSQR